MTGAKTPWFALTVVSIRVKEAGVRAPPEAQIQTLGLDPRSSKELRGNYSPSCHGDGKDGEIDGCTSLHAGDRVLPCLELTLSNEMTVPGPDGLEQALRVDGGSQVQGDNHSGEEGTEGDHICLDNWTRKECDGWLERGSKTRRERTGCDGRFSRRLCVSYRPDRVVCSDPQSAFVDFQAVCRNAPMSRLMSMIRGDRSLPCSRGVASSHRRSRRAILSHMKKDMPTTETGG